MPDNDKNDKCQTSECSVEVHDSSSKTLIPWKIYLSRALSAWGDRIWAFSVGIFMNKLAPENLRVVAIYGFVISISVIIFGAMIGNWIDRSKRLFAAKLLLSVQNLSVASACIVIVGHYTIWKEKVGYIRLMMLLKHCINKVNIFLIKCLYFILIAFS